MFGIFGKKPRESAEIRSMRSEGCAAPIVAKANADGRYAEFLIMAPDEMALIPRKSSVEALSAFVEAIESRIDRGDFNGRFDSRVPGDRRDLLTAPRHLVVALKEGKAQQAFFSWCPPETEQTIEHGTGRVVQSFGLSSFDIRIESNAGYDRFKLTATDRRTAQFAFSYGIERSPFMTCIMYVRADGTRFNLDCPDADMPYETFERMAVRFAIEQIYDDRLIPRSTLNAVATLAVADKIAKAGFQAFAIQKDETKGPQIVGVRDGIPSAVIVRADAYPSVGDIADIDDARLAELIEEHMLRKRDLYFASVTLINAEARNDYEKGVLLHNGSFRMSVDQFTLLTEDFEH